MLGAYSESKLVELHKDPWLLIPLSLGKTLNFPFPFHPTSWRGFITLSRAVYHLLGVL